MCIYVYNNYVNKCIYRYVYNIVYAISCIYARKIDTR